MKLAIFDLDGVLAHTSDIHTYALQRAIDHVFMGEAPQVDYLGAADGIRTKDKLQRLAASYGLSDTFVAKIDELKRMYTLEELSKLKRDERIIKGVESMKNRGYKVFVASNSRREFVDATLKAIGLEESINFSIAGDEVEFPKPDPQIFVRAMNFYDVIWFPRQFNLKEVYIFEDSPNGLKAAYATGANVIEVDPTTLITDEQFLLCK